MKKKEEDNEEERRKKKIMKKKKENNSKSLRLRDKINLKIIEINLKDSHDCP